MVKYRRSWMAGAVIAFSATCAATAASAAPAGVDGPPDEVIVATGEPPVPMGGAPATTIVIVATDDPPLPPLVAVGPPPTPPAVTNVSPMNPGNVILPQTGPRLQAFLALIAALLFGAGVGMLQVAARRRLAPVRVGIHRVR